MNRFTKLSTKVIFSVLLLAFLCLNVEENFAQRSSLITGNSVGNVRIGMKVSDARRVLRGYSFRRVSDGEGIALIGVTRNGRTHMTFYAGEFDANQPINENAVIEFIEVWDSQYRTSAGVYPQMPIRDAERRYGKLIQILLSEIESREYARFTNQPGSIDLRLGNRNGMAGIYERGKSVTTRYSSTSYIASIVVIGGSNDVFGSNDYPANNNNSNNDNNNNSNSGNDSSTATPNNTPVYTSQYTNLRTQCRTVRNQGRNNQHSSSFCQGYGDYQIHMFDTATTMEINVESKDRKRSIHLASQSLSFNPNNQRIEWRVRDGKPFAVIMRAYKYQLGNDGLIKYPERRTGEFLIVKGLPGFEHIDSEIDIRRVRNANEMARKSADDNYSKNANSNNNNNAFQVINVNRYNRVIEIAARNRENWVKSPMQIVGRLMGEIQEIQSRTIRFVSPSAEASDTMTVTVVDDGLLDDSVRAERLRFKLKKNRTGVWKIESGRKTWKCQPRRGHQNFSAVPCR